MKHSNNIRRFLAALFLLLFSFCVTPKRFLHDLLANHQDAKSYSGIPGVQISASGFHCHVDDLVVVAPFLPGIQNPGPVILDSAPFHYSKPLSLFVFSCLSDDRDTRGPPTAFCS